jgi:hypothetical protein
VIQTDDAASPTSNNANLWSDRPSKSQEVRAGLNSYVKMAFCYFTAASRADDVMNDFPNLGFSYGVFGSNATGQLGQGDRNNRGGVAGELGDGLPAIRLVSPAAP